MIQKDPICGMPIDTEAARFSAAVRGNTYYFCNEQHRRTFLEGSRIAYFSMEIGLRDEVPTYSGGLGILAGDTIRSSADLNIPLVAVTLISRKGYLSQKLTEQGDQLEQPDEWEPQQFMRSLTDVIEVAIEGRRVKVKPWIYDHQSPTGGLVSVVFLDTNLPENTPKDRDITSYLYGGDDIYRMKQEIVLGIGGVRMLDALGFNIKKYHMNEGHSSLLTLELLKRDRWETNTVRDLCVFTTHTSVEAAFDKFSYGDVQSVLGDDIPQDKLKNLAGPDRLNMTLLALNMSKYVNGVTHAHMEFSKRLFPGYHLKSVTNGIHPYTWASPFFREIFDRLIPGWANEPELLVRADEIPREEIWNAHENAKKQLIEYVNEKTDAGLDTTSLTIGFARRATAYKRPSLIFSDLERLKDIGRRQKLQLIFAGKAHPKDEGGKSAIRKIFGCIAELKGTINAIYLENYDMALAKMLTSGVDVWLNTPLPPMEASGTSGMKAALNGVANFSVLDGWWIEGCIEGVTGWSIGPTADEVQNQEDRNAWELKDIYSKLKYVIMPTFYRNKDEWLGIMRSSIGKIAYYFHSHRMMRRYATEAYL